MTFKDALRTLSTNFPVIILLPGWAKNITKHTRRVHLAFMELKVCFSESSLLPGVRYPYLTRRTAIHAGNGGGSQGWG